jgi:hypothetical protein
MAKMHDCLGRVTKQVVNDDGSLTVTLSLNRKNLEAWARIFDLPKWKATELCNPQKKKRGTMRRRRREKMGGVNE